MKITITIPNKHLRDVKLFKKVFIEAIKTLSFIDIMCDIRDLWPKREIKTCVI